MSENHNHKVNKLLIDVDSFIRNKTILSFQEFISTKKENSIIHTVPIFENIPLESHLSFEYIQDASNSEIKMKLGGINTTMTYIAGFDIFVGYRKFEDITFQLILRLVEFGGINRMQISYHNLNDPSDTAVDHDGTIHPIE